MYAHYMQKSSTDCGIASLRVILSQLEIKIKNVSELYKHYNLKKDQGLSLGELNEILLKYGVVSSAYEVRDFEELEKVEQLPMVLVVENEGYAHYVVVHAIEGEHYTVSNPAEPNLRVYEKEELRAIFLGYALCIEEIQTAPQQSSKKSRVNFRWKREADVGVAQILYKEVMSSLSFKTKASMVFLLFLKYVLPFATTMFIQALMQGITATSTTIDILKPIFVVGWLIFFFFIVNVREGKQKVKLENEIQEKILMSYYNQKISDLDSGKNLENVTGYFWNLVNSVSGLFQKFYFKINISYVVVLTIILANISSWLALALLFWSGVYTLYLRKNIQTIRNNEMDIIGKSSVFSSAIENNIKSSLDINVFSKTRQSGTFVKDKMKSFLSARLNNSVTELNVVSVYQSLVTLMSLSAFVILSIMTLYGEQDILIDTTTGIFIISIILNSLSPVVQSWLMYQKSTVAIDFIQSSNDYCSNVEIADKEVLGMETIEVIAADHLDFSYSQGKEIFKNFTIKMDAGNIYGIRGENGSGKSTLIKLLSGVLRPDDGEFIINNTYHLPSLKETNINEYIGMYSPEFNLYSNTVGRNIRYKVFNEELQEWEKNQYEDIFGLKLSNNHLVQMDAANLSQGQKQKILLMRALYEEKSIYIFDEPTGNLDSDSKAALMTKIIALAKEQNKIVILISHEKDVLDCSDEIIEVYKKEERYEKAY
ncbi:ATP-binding cassette domain-containing protein [Candidatus Enterococcus clewellii]|uniref:ABC transporter domain-containing protein n=1 Tax=Candidatus Enterococcus clewellii TaxID=1834193 RepID=A0A242K8E0_9ENTE|nr:ATP-binding cassette domain-containing protein [Enterococcus sp. 9E7_DIV0242]OTP17339.1 hypothetical protein A5888_001477 [Enterococcus sp. 9E7_DIV0242]